MLSELPINGYAGTEFSENTPSRKPGEYGLAPTHTPRCSRAKESHMYQTIVWPGKEPYLGVQHKPLLASRCTRSGIGSPYTIPSLASKEACFAPIETR